MQTLNAIDAVTPALARTKLVLFSPFRFGRTWKLAATGYLAFTATFFMPFPLIYFGFVPSLLHRGHVKEATVLVSIILFFTLLFLLFFYVCSRLEFVFFDIVLNRGEFVAPAWRKYGAQTWPWIAVKVALGAVLTLALEAPLMSGARRWFHIMAAMKPGQPPPPSFGLAILSFEFGLFAMFGALFLIGSLLTDFVLPSMALESSTLTEAFRRFFRLMKHEPGQIIGFIFMKVVLGIAGYIAQTIVMYILLLIFLIVVAVLFGLGYVVLHALHVPNAVMVIMAVVFGLIAYFGFLFYVTLGMLGTVLTFLQAYALYFLGGRYPLIGMGLDRSTPPVYYAVPPQGVYYPPPPVY